MAKKDDKYSKRKDWDQIIWALPMKFRVAIEDLKLGERFDFPANITFDKLRKASALSGPTGTRAKNALDWALEWFIAFCRFADQWSLDETGKLLIGNDYIESKAMQLNSTRPDWNYKRIREDWMSLCCLLNFVDYSKVGSIRSALRMSKEQRDEYADSLKSDPEREAYDEWFKQWDDAPAGQDAPRPEPKKKYEIEEIEEMPYRDLQALCKELEIKASGKEADVRERVCEKLGLLEGITQE